MKILSLVGARPQFIKEAVLNPKFKEYGIEEVLINSGQHYDKNMSDVFFDVLGMPQPKYDLNIGSGNHGEMTGKMMIAVEPIVEKEKPDVVLVYGDTNTTLAGALVASKLKIPIAHVEAGIRMEPKTMPEEINRVITDRISSYLFCPSQRSIEVLRKEGIEKGVFFTGDVMFDLFLRMKPYFTGATRKSFHLIEGEYILLTLHRDYNVDTVEVLQPILSAVAEVSKDIKVVFPVHPRTKRKIEEFRLDSLLSNVIVAEPLDYLEMMDLVCHCYKVVTDSGGLQKESYFAGKQAVVLMPDTGWIELVEAGVNRLSDGSTLYANIFGQTEQQMATDIYGNGDSGTQICEILI